MFVQLGADIDGTAAGNNSWSSVSLSSDGIGVKSGYVRVYEYRTVSSTEWVDANIIKGTDTVWSANKKYWMQKINRVKLINTIYKKSLPTVIPQYVKFTQNKFIPWTVSSLINSEVNSAGINKIADNVYIVRK